MIKSKERLAACITLSLLLQYGVGYMAVQGANVQIINKNDGAGAQPQIASVPINVTDSTVINSDKTYFGVYSTGQSTSTQINLTGTQSINLSGDVNTTYKAYGLYNENGAQTEWQTNANTGDGISVGTDAYTVGAYGVYNTGAHSNVNVQSNGGSGLDISATGTSTVTNDNSAELPQSPPTGTVVGVWGDAGAVNTISAKTISATGQSNYMFSGNESQMYDQNLLNQLNASIDSAAEAYAAVVDKYDTYADEQSYLAALDKAQLGVDTAIARYNTVAGGMDVIGIYGNNSAVNQITATSVSAQVQGASIGDSVSDEVSSGSGSTISFTHTTSVPINVQGVYGNNSAVNQITATSVFAQVQNITASIGDSVSDEVSSGSGSAISFTHTTSVPINVQGVYGNNSAVNQITATSVSAQVQGASIGDSVSDEVSSGSDSAISFTHTTSVPINVQGVYGNNSAVNQITATSVSAQVQNVTASIGDSVSDEVSSGSGSAISFTHTTSVPINGQGVYGNNSAVNQITATSVSAQVQGVMASIGDYTQTSDDANSTNTAVIMSVPISVQGIYGGQGATNIVNADLISADVGGSLNIYSENEGGSGTSGINTPIVIAGVYGDTGAVNDITTNSITATSSMFSSSIGDLEITPSSVNVFGIYGTGQSTTNIHSKETNGTVEISVGISQNTSADGTVDTTNANTYGLYLNNATVNFYNNVKVVGQAVAAGSAGSALGIAPITYLKDANVTFAGYNDYYDNYYYDPDTATYGKNIAGSSTFHTYTSDTGILNLQGSNTFTVNTDLAHNTSDKLSFASLSNESTGTNYVAVATDASILKNSKGTINGKTVVIEIADADNALTAKGNQFIFNNAAGVSTDVTFEGKNFSTEGVLRKYKITPIVETEYDGDSKNVIITAIDYDMASPSEGLMTASDAQLAMRNIGLVENSTLMHRMGELRQDLPVEDGIWAKFSRGEFAADSSYGRTFDQSYNQFYLGYDKQRSYKNGKLYTGVAVSHIDGNVDYERGDGTAKSTAVSLYGTWFGDKGHYLDVLAKAGRLSNKFAVMDDNSNNVSADYSTNGYNLSAEYGYRKKLEKGYFVEPQVQLSLGRIQGVDYQLSSGATIHQGDINSAVGRVGVLGGKTFANGSNAYIKASVLRDFGGSGSVVGYYGTDSLAVDTVGNSTWVEVGVGANIKLREGNNLYFDALKTFGGNVRQKWQFEGGSRWKF